MQTVCGFVATAEVNVIVLFAVTIIKPVAVDVPQLPATVIV